MKAHLIGKCPVCQDEMIVTELKCTKCGTTIRGEFGLSDFDKLSEPQMRFAEIFLKDGGNIKAIEKELNISYPTVKKLLSEVVASLGLPNEDIPLEKEDTKDQILADLKAGTIDFDEAEKRLSAIGESIK